MRARYNSNQNKYLKQRNENWFEKCHSLFTIALLLLCIKLLFFKNNDLIQPINYEKSSSRFNAKGGETIQFHFDEKLTDLEKCNIRISRKTKEINVVTKQVNEFLKKVTHAEKKYKKIEKEINQKNNLLDDLEIGISKLKKENKDFQKKLEKQELKESTDNNKDQESMKKIQKALIKANKKKEEAIAKLSKKLLYAEFGENEPYRAKITVVYPESLKSNKERGDIVIEFASSDLMPTAVLFVLTQIKAGAWNGMSFIRNAGHVLQASSQTVNREYDGKRFKLEYQDSSIPFQEYSPLFPHKKYTLGLAGRPGGPDFYISTTDNTKNHGPGGQVSYTLQNEADSCFAKVIEGFDVVDLMHTAEHEHDDFNGLVDYIEIESIKIL